MTKLLTSVLVAFLALPAAQAAAAPSIVVWSGGREAGTTADGVVLRADGSGERLGGDAAGRAHARGPFTPRGAALERIRAAAEDVLDHAPAATSAPNVIGGSYAAAVVVDGARQKFVFDVNEDSAPMTTLLRRLDEALPRGSRVTSATGRAFSPPISVRAHAAGRGFPNAGFCNSGESPVSVIKHLSLPEAVAAGVASGLVSKGTVSGDTIGGDFKDVPNLAADTTITVHADVTTDIPGLSEQDAVRKVSGALNGGPNQYDVDGHSVQVNWVLGSHGPDAAAGCAHQILLTDYTDANGNPGHSSTFVDSKINGTATNSARLVASDPSFAAEAQHQAGFFAFGFPDRTSDYLHTSFGDIPLPGASGPALEALGLVDNPSSARVMEQADPGSDPNDIMAFPHGPDPSFLASDLKAFIDANATIKVEGTPGQFLGNKHIGDQNFGVGARDQIVVPPGKSVHVDGIVAYCLDLLDHGTPAPGADTFDVLPKVGDLGGEGMQALQRVLDVVAARQPAPLEETPGASAAIWRVTDNLNVDRDGDPAAASILDAAGVPLDPAQKTYDTPHIADPAASIPFSVALSSMTDPTPIPAPAPVARPAVVKGSKLTHLWLGRRRVPLARKKRSALVEAFVQLAGRSDRVSLALVRRLGHRTITVARTRPHLLRGGETTALLLVGRDVKPGAYRLLARSAHGGTLGARVTVTRART
jgi:hypothetical protein